MAVARIGDSGVDGLVLTEHNVVTPTFRNAHVDQSTDIYFGDQNIFYGPVSVEKIVLKNGVAVPETPDPSEDGNRTDGAINKNDVSADKEIPTPGPRNVLDLLKSKTRQRPLVTTAIILAIIICIITVIVFRPTGAGEGLTILSRAQWGATPPINDTTPLVTPVPYVIIHHTATVKCSEAEECIRHVQYIQTFHIESRQFYDIGYNFLVGGDGTAFEGRGWTVEGAHSYGYNYRSIGIALVGTFITMKPPEAQMATCRKLIAKGVQLGYIQKDYKLLAARQLAGTESPGAAFFAEMKTWPHWASEP